MTSRHYIWIPFGELLHRETSVTDPIFARGPGNPEWWEQRAWVLETYTLPSLLNQDPPLPVWAGIAEETCHLCGPVVRALTIAGARVVLHPARDATKYGKGVAHEAVRTALESADVVTFLLIDSDDMYLKGATAYVTAVEPAPGLVLTFRKGYVLNAETGEMRIYDPGKCPPPFFSRCYTREWLDDPDAYEERWRYRVPHHRLLRSPNRQDLPDDKFVVVSHGRNTSSLWGRLLERGRLGAEICGDGKDWVLEQCGVR